MEVRLYLLSCDLYPDSPFSQIAVTFGFTQTMYQVPEEDSEGNGYVVEVCVELLSGELDREVVVALADLDGSAVGEY